MTLEAYLMTHQSDCGLAWSRLKRAPVNLSVRASSAIAQSKELLRDISSCIEFQGKPT
jgi:hypothetical protein